MFQANQQIGGYTLIKQIGRGGFGEVWLAERRTEILTTQVAIKLPHREQVNLEAIRQEAELWAKASGHANILPIIEANIYDGQIVIISEYAPDGSLEEIVQQEIPINQTLETVIGILNGLDFLHARQIIHRDIKPANILLQGETPRLADFGISRIIKTTALSTSIVGTPKYMAPEAFDGKRTVQTDIWSVGVILYQMLCGTVPFPQDNPTELMWAIVTKEPTPIPESVPPDLRKIVQKSLAKLPENRFPSAREMREEVQRALLNISHPTFAPTQVLEKPIHILPDAQTIEDRLTVTNSPNYQIPPTELVNAPQNPSVATYFVAPTINQNNLEANFPTQFNSLPPTVPQVTEITNNQKQGFHFGLLFPQGKWKLGILLSVFFIVITIYTQSIIPLFLAIITTITTYLTSYIAARLSPRKPATDLAKTSEEWTTARIVRWIFYYVAPIIGILMILVSGKISEFVFKQTILSLIYRWSINPFLLVDTLITILYMSVFFGIAGVALGYSFPKEKWRWGLWLNIINIIAIWKIRNYFALFGFDFYNTWYLDEMRFFLLASIIQNSFLFVFSCFASYLGSWLATRKTEKKVLQG